MTSGSQYLPDAQAVRDPPRVRCRQAGRESLLEWPQGRVGSGFGQKNFVRNPDENFENFTFFFGRRFQPSYVLYLRNYFRFRIQTLVRNPTLRSHWDLSALQVVRGERGKEVLESPRFPASPRLPSHQIHPIDPRGEMPATSRLSTDQYPSTEPPTLTNTESVLLKIPSLSSEPTERELQLKNDLRNLMKKAVVEKEMMRQKLNTIQTAYDDLMVELLKVQDLMNQAFKEKNVREARQHWKNLSTSFNAISKKLYENLKGKRKKRGNL